MKLDIMHLALEGLENAQSAEMCDKMISRIIQSYGKPFAVSVMSNYVKRRLMASGHEVSPKEIANYVEKVSEGISDANAH